jgi:exo-beta-1,3-glucanase (GH17 family)
MRQEFHSRYVRLYGACDSGSFNDDLIESAWEAGVGIYPLIWFGFNSDNKWKSRKQKLLQAIKNNPKAPYVVRGVVMGSEPLFDGVLPVDQLVGEMDGIKQELKQFTDQKTHGGSAMHVTSSDMSYSYQKFDSKSKILQTATVLQANVLPFFSQSAKFGNSADAMKGIKDTYTYLRNHSGGKKKIIFAQTGWPSTSEVWKGNSKDAVASVASEEAYFKMLDKAACEDPTLSKGPQGGLGWFAHIWSDSGLPGWGVVDSNGKRKFDFKPRTSCH